MLKQIRKKMPKIQVEVDCSELPARSHQMLLVAEACLVLLVAMLQSQLMPPPVVDYLVQAMTMQRKLMRLLLVWSVLVVML